MAADKVVFCARMESEDAPAAEELFLAFLQQDPHYLDVASVYGDRGPGALRRALHLFIDRPELGFVWMARRGGEVVGCCVACFAISTSRGAIVAKLDDVNVRPGHEGQGIGSAMLASLKDELRRRYLQGLDEDGASEPISFEALLEDRQRKRR